MLNCTAIYGQKRQLFGVLDLLPECITQQCTLFAVWGALQEMVYHQRRFTSVDELKTVIVTEWQKLSQRFINRAINQWRRRLECVVQQQGA